MRFNAIRPWLGTVIRLVLGVVWIWAASSKLVSPRAFVQTVRAYDATPEWLSEAIGYGLPVLELSIGLLLVVGVAVRMSAIASGVLLLVFLIGLVQAAARDIQLDCGCFGGGGVTAGGTSYTLDILRDIGLFVLAGYLVLWSFTRLSLEEFIARHDYVELPSAKQLRTEKGARKYNAMVELRRKEARSRNLYLNGSLAIIVVLIVLIGAGVQSGRAKIAGSLTATHASVSHGVIFGKKAAATVDIYEDFQCPNCLDFEKAAAKTADADVRANKAQIRFHMVAFLDSSGNHQYSTRAANAALCASDVSVEDFVAYHNLLYGTYRGQQVQPAETAGGRADGDFVKYAQQIGVPTGDKLTTFTSCVQDQTHKALVQAITDNASERGVNSTPTIKVNGRSIGATLAAFNKAVAAALKKGPAPVPSTTPSPSPSATTPKTPSTPASSSAPKASPSP